MNGIQQAIIKHPGITKLVIAGFGAWMALAIYDIGRAQNQLNSAWQLATSEALGG